MVDAKLDQRNLRTLVEGELSEGVLSRMPEGLEKDFALLDLAVNILRKYKVDDAADKVELWGRRKKFYLIGRGGKGRSEIIEAIRGETGRFMPAETGKAPVVVNNNPQASAGSNGSNGSNGHKKRGSIFGQLKG